MCKAGGEKLPSTDWHVWMAKAEAVVKPVRIHFLSKFGRAHGQIDGCDFEAFMKIIRAADIFNPWVAVTVEAAKAMEYLEDSTLIRVITAEMVRKLKDEWGRGV